MDKNLKLVEDAKIDLIKKLEELEHKMEIPLPSQEVLNNINVLSKDIRQLISFLKTSEANISIQERRYNRIISDMNKHWPYN